jgi:hypothetical protein
MPRVAAVAELKYLAKVKERSLHVLMSGFNEWRLPGEA